MGFTTSVPVIYSRNYYNGPLWQFRSQVEEEEKVEP
jgi:hypothetical protein